MPWFQKARKFRYFFDKNEPLDNVYSNPNYIAILVKTDSGQRIVIAQFDRWRTNDAIWETRVYDVK